MNQTNRWDPRQYQRFSRERSRPFFDLIGQIPDDNVQTVADLGCGPGNLTQTLCTRWPDTTIYGVDNSPHMLEQARQLPSNPNLHFIEADIATWKPDTLLNRIVSNAAIQWVPDHTKVLEHLVSLLAPHGVLAVQLPRNFDESAHRLLYELVRKDPWAAFLSSWKERYFVETPSWYVHTLQNLGLQVDLWETIYQHILEGEDAVLEWMKGTALRPALTRLPSRQHEPFLDAYRQVLRSAYPQGQHGTLFPFRRLFFVAQRS
jgi:trans-aconitate 2-methyltransferase